MEQQQLPQAARTSEPQPSAIPVLLSPNVLPETPAKTTTKEPLHQFYEKLSFLGNTQKNVFKLTF